MKELSPSLFHFWRSSGRRSNLGFLLMLLGCFLGLFVGFVLSFGLAFFCFGCFYFGSRNSRFYRFRCFYFGGRSSFSGLCFHSVFSAFSSVASPSLPRTAR